MSYSNSVKKFTGVLSQTAVLVGRCDGVRRYDTTCYFNVRSKADLSALNLPHGNVAVVCAVCLTSTVTITPAASSTFSRRLWTCSLSRAQVSPATTSSSGGDNNSITSTGWAKKVTSQTHGHDFVKSKPILKLFFTGRFCSKFAVAR